MKITVFTPAYNRAYTLDRLYRSLTGQNFEDFEWLVVDDGSTDETEQKIGEFISQKRISIRCFKTVNQGKLRAMNFGVTKAYGKLFFILDSDDYLAGDALNKVWENYLQIKDDLTFGGIIGLRPFANGQTYPKVDYKKIDCTYPQWCARYNFHGETADVFLTTAIKEFPFPVIADEHYFSEDMLWYQMAKKYKMRFISDALVYGEYLPDGITKNIGNLRKNNPLSFMMYYRYFSSQKTIPLRRRFRFCYEYWLFWKVYHKKFKQVKTDKEPIPFWGYIIFFYVILSFRKLRY
ncbi:MAG: glycosyltransferase family 2 protein [Bacteroidales bacterium]|jgi:glycosyltransferase involved in cell wall biosynthesis|nr:glycosyltransferase family 2 protein [Bacteroidales bacterium]